MRFAAESSEASVSFSGFKRPRRQSRHGLQVGIASDASVRSAAESSEAWPSSPTGFKRPRRQSRHGLQVGIASDASVQCAAE